MARLPLGFPPLLVAALASCASSADPWIPVTKVSEPQVMRARSAKVPAKTSTQIGKVITIHYEPPADCQTITTARESVTTYVPSGSFLWGPPKPRTETKLVDEQMTKTCTPSCAATGRAVHLEYNGSRYRLGALDAGGRLTISMDDLIARYPALAHAPLLTALASSVRVDESGC